MTDYSNMEKLKKFIISKIESLESNINDIKRMNYSDDTEIHQAKISILNEVLEKMQESQNPVDLTYYKPDLELSEYKSIFSDTEIRGCNEE